LILQVFNLGSFAQYVAWIKLPCSLDLRQSVRVPRHSVNVDALQRHYN